MRAYKFLDAAGRAPFTGTPWTLGQRMEATAAVPCHEGVHGCRAADVAHWFADSMWELELDGEIVDSHHKVVSSRGSLVRLLDGYPAAVRELGEIGAWRSRDRAVEALRDEGDGALADRFAEATTLDQLAVLGAEVDDATWSGTAAGLAADAAHFAVHGDHAQSPFVAACSAGHRAAGTGGDQAAYDAGYATERQFQSEWISARLGLR
jgi:hypothetical protein